MNNEEQDTHFLVRWFSVGDAITLIVLFVAVIASYTSTSKDIESLKLAVSRLEARDITPGAANRLSILETKMMQADHTLEQQRDDAADFRREVRDSLARIEAKLDEHSRER